MAICNHLHASTDSVHTSEGKRTKTSNPKILRPVALMALFELDSQLCRKVETVLLIIMWSTTNSHRAVQCDLFYRVIISAEQLQLTKTICFCSNLFACSSAGLWKTTDPIFIKHNERVYSGPRNDPLNFGVDPNHNFLTHTGYTGFNCRVAPPPPPPPPPRLKRAAINEQV